MARSICSVCGAEGGGCDHVRGQRYGDRLCFLELQDPVDAYEWSFVAVPAQRDAGVLKRLGGREGDLATVRKEAALGRKYLAGLRREVVRLAMLADEDLDGELFARAAEKLEEPDLLALKQGYEKRAAKRFPATPQLAAALPAEPSGSESVFLV